MNNSATYGKLSFIYSLLLNGNDEDFSFIIKFIMLDFQLSHFIRDLTRHDRRCAVYQIMIQPTIEL